MNINKQKFEQIIWPEEFIVEFQDGEEQIFVSSQGVQWSDGEDMDENRPNINCCWKKKSPSQQSFKHIEFYVDEVSKFKTISGEVIWEPNK